MRTCVRRATRTREELRARPTQPADLADEHDDSVRRLLNECSFSSTARVLPEQIGAMPRRRSGGRVADGGRCAGGRTLNGT